MSYKMALSLPLTIIFLYILNEVNANVITRTIFGMNYYVDLHQPVKWQQAMALCAVNEMNLVDIPTYFEHDRILSLIDIAKIELDINPVMRFWTSGSDLADQLKWAWATTGHQLVYTNWQPNEPNNYHKNEHCISIEWRNKTGKIGWNDLDCGGKAYTICRDKLYVPFVSEIWETITPN